MPMMCVERDGTCTVEVRGTVQYSRSIETMRSSIIFLDLDFLPGGHFGTSVVRQCAEFAPAHSFIYSHEYSISARPMTVRFSKIRYCTVLYQRCRYSKKLAE